MNLVTEPTENHIKHLYKWLEEEERETGEGFFCNWNIIYKAYEEKKLFVVESNSKAVALLVFWELSPNAGIDILSVEPNYRNKGIGKLLVHSFFKFTKRKGTTKIEILSKPVTSEGFWLSLGFREKEDKKCKRINGIPMQKIILNSKN